MEEFYQMGMMESLIKFLQEKKSGEKNYYGSVDEIIVKIKGFGKLDILIDQIKDNIGIEPYEVKGGMLIYKLKYYNTKEI